MANNNNLVLIIAVIIGVFLFSGGLTGNVIFPNLRVPTSPVTIQQATMTNFNPITITTDINNLKASDNVLKTNTWNQYVSLLQKDAELSYKINKLDREESLAATNPGCTCICGEKGVYGYGRACFPGCGVSGGSGGGPTGGGSSLCNDECKNYCGADPVISATCQNIC